MTNAQILVAAGEIGAVGKGLTTMPLVLATLCDPSANAEDVARIIGQEPGLAARVLRVANSAYYGASGSVSTLERAFVLLGVDAVRGIAAAACLNRATSRAAKSAPFDMAEMLRHSIGVAAAAEALARMVRRPLAPEAFIAGLLHDFGVTLQLHVDRPGLGAILEALRANPTQGLRELERLHCRVGHERCATVTFEAWKLPPSLIEVVRCHHDPAATTHSALTAIVRVADHLSILTGLGYDFEPVAGPAPVEDMAMLAITAEHLDWVAKSLPDRVSELQASLAAT
ncbi:MAG TPA: HDOD domain-containing protein [Steroidobacteraceae bacterium]|nr:HDOD domain-containing protein [Steroidobacteraceae bacterium]